MNSAQELHIAVRQGLEKIDSFQDEALFPEEIDLQLNRSQDRYLEMIINNRFEDTQTRLDHLSNLIVRNKSLTAIVPNTTDTDFEANAVYGILPADYKALINDRSTVVSSSTACTDLGSIPTSTFTEYVAEVTFPEHIVTTTAPFFNRPEIRVNNVQVYLTPEAIEIFNNIGSKFVIINDMIETINSDETLPYTIYFERYRELFKKNTFFFVTTDTSLNNDPVTINLFQSDKTTVDGTNTALFSSTDYLVYNTSTIANPVTNTVPNRSMEKEHLYDYLSINPFYKTKATEPLSTITNRVTVFRDKSFIISNITIDYIRRPKQISLPLDQSCELSESGARRIVDLTIEYFKLTFENPSYQGFVQDNNLRNEITK